MIFEVYDKGLYPHSGKNRFYFCRDNWDDYTYKTTFDAYFYDSTGVCQYIGQIKIGYCEMSQNTRVYDEIPKQFERLPDKFFSLGQSTDYYENIARLGDYFRCEIMIALNDVAFNKTLFEKVKNERVMSASLMRDVTMFSIQNQLHRMANGGAKLTTYQFSYHIKNSIFDTGNSTIDLDFSVIPNSNPPSNIHVLIGRNGTGKTHLLKSMIQSIHSNNPVNTFQFDNIGDYRYSAAEQFANTLCVAFSPFDNYPTSQEICSSIPYTYIGLDKTSGDLLASIENQFIESFNACMSTPEKKRRWKQTIDILKSDPMFTESGIDSFADEKNCRSNADSKKDEIIKNAFSRLSSGHKVVLLIISCCVDKLEEQSIVLLDEPENHLHPPLLSAFIRALSHLLVDRNGVAIISTHSPVVLQEVPSSCVWALYRSGDYLTAERLSVETFGTSIGTLTSEVFGLEVTDSGFHKLLCDAVERNDDYDSIVDEFEDKLGSEARVLLRTLLATKKQRG